MDPHDGYLNQAAIQASLEKRLNEPVCGQFYPKMIEIITASLVKRADRLLFSQYSDMIDRYQFQ
jgi:hypothetical protein